MTFALETAGPETQNNLQEVLFRSYFTEGKYPDVANLVAVAAEVGLPEAAARAALEDRRYEAGVKKEAEESSRVRGVSGVPHFFVNGRNAFSGAQPPEAILQALRSA
mmetsp:Transcript_89477/g.161414  ORF Transcript_89477/g.161414 Transcript_89477/m.161414 type:complete len:107 (+) Transcript_89477:394-714(+)